MITGKAARNVDALLFAAGESGWRQVPQALRQI
jgi:hypothetical protein